MKKAFIHTFGCRLNIADSALLGARLEKAGFTLIDCLDSPLALIVVNSCAVTAEAERKSLQFLRQIRRKHPESQIVFTGCSAERSSEGFYDSGADFVFPNPGKIDIVQIIAGSSEATGVMTSAELDKTIFREKSLSNFPFRSRAFIKIQEGCDNFCSYCIVPVVRGRARSRDWDEVLSDCRAAVRAGMPELVLTGVNICTYSSGGKFLADLLDELGAWEGAFRIRLGSSEPNLGNVELLERMAANPKVCRFLHLSLQSGSDRVLQKMNRRYDSGQYLEFITAARELIADLHLGTDVITGFPGESENDFAIGQRFIEECDFANIHIFRYSRRPGTPAANMPDQIDTETQKNRFNSLQHIADKSRRAFAEKQLGKIIPVIFEEVKEGVATGWSDNYLQVSAPASEVELGKILSRRYDKILP